MVREQNPMTRCHSVFWAIKEEKFGHFVRLTRFDTDYTLIGEKNTLSRFGMFSCLTFFLVPHILMSFNTWLQKKKRRGAVFWCQFFFRSKSMQGTFVDLFPACLQLVPAAFLCFRLLSERITFKICDFLAIKNDNFLTNLCFGKIRTSRFDVGNRKNAVFFYLIYNLTALKFNQKLSNQFKILILNNFENKAWDDWRSCGWTKSKFGRPYQIACVQSSA